MQDQSGHNYRTALRADLATAETRVAMAAIAYSRAEAELERSCWQGNAHAPVDHANAAREALRAMTIRRAERRAEEAEYDYELIDADDCYDDDDDVAA